MSPNEKDLLYCIQNILDYSLGHTITDESVLLDEFLTINLIQVPNKTCTAIFTREASAIANSPCLLQPTIIPGRSGIRSIVNECYHPVV